VLFVKASGVWLLILVCAVLNGALREAVLLPAFDKSIAFVVSGVLLSTCIFALSIILVPRLGALSVGQSLWLGVFWLVLTLAFEFGFGRLVQERSWSELFQAYTFDDGNIWPLVLVVTFFSPVIAVRMRPRRSVRGTGRE
jgi:hypothetical protein